MVRIEPYSKFIQYEKFTKKILPSFRFIRFIIIIHGGSLENFRNFFHTQQQFTQHFSQWENQNFVSPTEHHTINIYYSTWVRAIENKCKKVQRPKEHTQSAGSSSSSLIWHFSFHILFVLFIYFIYNRGTSLIFHAYMCVCVC